MKKRACAATRQLPLRLTLTPARVAELGEEERRHVILALARLVLEAHRPSPEESNDEAR